MAWDFWRETRTLHRRAPLLSSARVVGNPLGSTQVLATGWQGPAHSRHGDLERRRLSLSKNLHRLDECGFPSAGGHLRSTAFSLTRDDLQEIQNLHDRDVLEASQAQQTPVARHEIVRLRLCRALENAVIRGIFLENVHGPEGSDLSLRSPSSEPLLPAGAPPTTRTCRAASARLRR